MVKTKGMLPGPDHFLSHVSLVFDDRKSQPLIAGAVDRIRGGGEVREGRMDLESQRGIFTDAEIERIKEEVRYWPGGKSP